MYSPTNLLSDALKAITHYHMIQSLEGENGGDLVIWKRFAKIILSKIFLPKSRSSFECIASYLNSDLILNSMLSFKNRYHIL